MNIVGNKNLPALKYNACCAVDSAAELCRLNWITPGVGQSMVYTQKAIEAENFLIKYPDSNTAINTPSTDWPLISAELNITAPTMWQVAEVFSQFANQFLGVAAQIEQLRMAAKDSIGKATNIQTITNAQNVNWPTKPITVPET